MFYPQVIVILIVIAVDLTSTLPQDGALAAVNVTTESTVFPSQTCVTGKHVVGVCVKRERCDYGTAAIDLTLYRPRGYKLSCPPGEDVCCPPRFLVQQDDRVLIPENRGFDFDDDD